MDITPELAEKVLRGGTDAIAVVRGIYQTQIQKLDAIEKQASQVLEAAEMLPLRWIPVSERLPEQGVRCIIAMRIPGRYVIDGEPKDGYEIEFGEWRGDRWKTFFGFGETTLHPSMVKHWMPLPPPPEQP